MTTTRTPGVVALPNVLQDQTVPNTIGGIGPPIVVGPRRRPSGRVLMVGAAAIVAAIVLVVSRAG